MRNKRVKRQSIPIVNLYGLGSQIKQGWQGMNSGQKASAIGGAASELIGAASGGTETKAGNIMGGIGSTLSSIPTPFTQIAGAGLSVVGGLVNAAFGTKWNKEFIAQTESGIKEQANTQWDASSNADLLSSWDDFDMMSHVSRSQVGKDGWFSNKAKKKARKLNAQIDDANERAVIGFNNRVEGVDTQNDLAVAANFADLGGYLFRDGGGIHIKKENRGKFTEYCGGKVTSECIQRGLHSSNSTTRKRANFARNARKWHAFGGELGTNGTDWTNGVTIFGEGGTHEENPNQGIPQGVDQNGVPNLVEEGEVKYQDYIFSNRLKADKEILEMVGLPDKYKRKKYSDLAEKASKESEERPNDPISKAGLEDSMLRLQVAQEVQRAKKKGNKFSKGGRLFDAGGFRFRQDVPGSNQFVTNNRDGSVGVTIGSYPIGVPSFGNYRVIPMEAPVTRRAAEAGIAESILGTIPSNRDIANTLMATYGAEGIGQGGLPIEDIPEIRSAAIQSTASDEGSALPTYMRYAPALGGALGALAATLTPVDAPDYRNADSIIRSRRSVGYTPLTQKLTYRPFDREFYQNKLNAQAGATRRAIANASNGNRGTLIAGLTAADYNAQNQMGDLFRQAEEYNQAQRERVAGFNRQTDQANAQMGIQTGMFNSQMRQQAAAEAARMRMIENQRYRADRAAKRDAIAANFTNFLESLGGIGEENYWRNAIDSLRRAGVYQAGTDLQGRVKRSGAKGGKLKLKL